MTTEAPQYRSTYYGDKVYVEGTGKFGQKVKPLYSKGNGMNREYYSLGNIGWWLSMQRQIAGMKRTQVADAMHWPHGAIKEIEEGRRIPKAKTVQKYLDVLSGEFEGEFGNMYGRFHKVSIPDMITLDDLRKWLESLPPNTVVQDRTDNVRSASCVVTHYARKALNLEGAQTGYTRVDVDYDVEIPVEQAVTDAIAKFDSANEILTAREALEIINND